MYCLLADGCGNYISVTYTVSTEKPAYNEYEGYIQRYWGFVLMTKPQYKWDFEIIFLS